MFKTSLRLLFRLPAMIALAGCTQKSPLPPISAAEPIGLQMLRTEAQLSRHPFLTLLGFERETDSVFVRVERAAASIDASRSHTGSQSLCIPAGARSMTVKLSSLHRGRAWPENWTLVGAYFYAEKPQRLVVSYEEGGASHASYHVALPPGRWTPVLVDIAAALAGKTTADAGSLRYSFESALAQNLWCDDVIEMNNTGTLIDTLSTPDIGWTVRERGFRYTVERPGAFRLTLTGAEAEQQGWRLEEANEIRARFSSAGRPASRIIYASGRQYTDGEFRALDAALADRLAAQDAAPARITVAPDTGRLDRNSAGDANNDGYSEATGAYQIIATGPRLELEVSPTTAPLLHPVLEIRGLPAGKVLTSMEGKLLERTARLDDGRVL